MKRGEWDGEVGGGVGKPGTAVMREQPSGGLARRGYEGGHVGRRAQRNENTIAVGEVSGGHSVEKRTAGGLEGKGERRRRG